MKPSITWAKDKLKILFSIIFWVAVWQIAALAMDKEVLLASPGSTFKALISLIGEPAFWPVVFFSVSRILVGFFAGLICGVVLAALSARYRFVKVIFSPLFTVIKSVPVASFVILALLWVRGANLSVVISFLMVLPIVYTNMCRGFESVDKKLLEMAGVFHIGKMKTFLYIYLPRILPFFTSACTASLGLCWKSGVAAEVIGLPQGSIGNRLYETKLYLNTPGMFAWTIVIVLISFSVEKLFIFLLDKLNGKIRKGFL